MPGKRRKKKTPTTQKQIQRKKDLKQCEKEDAEQEELALHLSKDLMARLKAGIKIRHGANALKIVVAEEESLLKSIRSIGIIQRDKGLLRNLMDVYLIDSSSVDEFEGKCLALIQRISPGPHRDELESVIAHWLTLSFTEINDFYKAKEYLGRYLILPNKDRQEKKELIFDMALRYEISDPEESVRILDHMEDADRNLEYWFLKAKLYRVLNNIEAVRLCIMAMKNKGIESLWNYLIDQSSGPVQNIQLPNEAEIESSEHKLELHELISMIYMAKGSVQRGLAKMKEIAINNNSRAHYHYLLQAFILTEQYEDGYQFFESEEIKVKISDFAEIAALKLRIFSKLISYERAIEDTNNLLLKLGITFLYNNYISALYIDAVLSLGSAELNNSGSYEPIIEESLRLDQSNAYARLLSQLIKKYGKLPQIAEAVEEDAAELARLQELAEKASAKATPVEDDAKEAEADDATVKDELTSYIIELGVDPNDQETINKALSSMDFWEQLRHKYHTDSYNQAKKSFGLSNNIQEELVWDIGEVKYIYEAGGASRVTKVENKPGFYAIIDDKIIAGLDKAVSHKFETALSKYAYSFLGQNGIKFIGDKAIELKINADLRLVTKVIRRNSKGAKLIIFDRECDHPDFKRFVQDSVGIQEELVGYDARPARADSNDGEVAMNADSSGPADAPSGGGAVEAGSKQCAELALANGLAMDTATDHEGMSVTQGTISQAEGGAGYSLLTTIFTWIKDLTKYRQQEVLSSYSMERVLKVLAPQYDNVKCILESLPSAKYVSETESNARRNAEVKELYPSIELDEVIEQSLIGGMLIYPFQKHVDISGATSLLS